MSLSVQDIQYFLAVAHSGQLSSAADELGLTQSALSKAVQRVEREFGLELFERSVRGMGLTSAGLRVVDQMRKLQADYADTVMLADEMRALKAGMLRLGVTDTTSGNRMAEVLAPLLNQRPGLRIRLRVDRSDALAAQVREGSLDLALVPAYDGDPLGVERTKVDDDPLLPIVRAGHPLAGRNRLAVRDVAAFGWMMGPPQSAAYRALRRVFENHGLAQPLIVMEVPFSSEMNLSVLEGTDLVTLVPRSLMRHTAVERFSELPVPALRIPRAVVLLSRPDTSWTPLMRLLREGLLARGREASRAARPGAA